MNVFVTEKLTATREREVVLHRRISLFEDAGCRAAFQGSCWPALRNTYDAIGMLPGADACHLAFRGLRTL